MNRGVFKFWLKPDEESFIYLNGLKPIPIDVDMSMDRSLITILFIIHYSLFIIHYSLFIIHYSLLIKNGQQ